jgi:hypothetical protein
MSQPHDSLVGAWPVMSDSVELPAGGRPWLVASTLLSAIAFGWAALVLPWRPGAPVALLAWGLGVSHLCAAGALAWRPEHARRPLLVLAFVSLAAAAVFAYAIGSTGVQMVEMFGALGWGLAAALGAIGWLVMLGTLPMGLYLFHFTRRRHARR